MRKPTVTSHRVKATSSYKTSFTKRVEGILSSYERTSPGLFTVINGDLIDNLMCLGICIQTERFSTQSRNRLLA